MTINFEALPKTSKPVMKKQETIYGDEIEYVLKTKVWVKDKDEYENGYQVGVARYDYDYDITNTTTYTYDDAIIAKSKDEIKNNPKKYNYNHDMDDIIKLDDHKYGVVTYDYMDDDIIPVSCYDDIVMV